MAGLRGTVQTTSKLLGLSIAETVAQPLLAYRVRSLALCGLRKKRSIRHTRTGVRI